MAQERNNGQDMKNLVESEHTGNGVRFLQPVDDSADRLGETADDHENRHRNIDRE